MDFNLQPPKRKITIDPARVVQHILEQGVPSENASHNAPDGYWYKIAHELLGKCNPSPKYVASVATYWYCNRCHVFQCAQHNDSSPVTYDYQYNSSRSVEVR